MASARMTMHTIKEILRLKWIEGLSGRQIAQSCKLSPSTVSVCLKQARDAHLTWDDICTLDEETLQKRLYPSKEPLTETVEPDFKTLDGELKRKGVTRKLLWQEYHAEHGDKALGYSQFCDRYRRWKKARGLVMRQEHKAGDTLFVDYAGATIDVVNRETGDVKAHPVFVAALGCSSYTYAEAQDAATLWFWVRGHIATFEYFGGVTDSVVPDNLKVGVTKPCYYEPDINRSYLEFAKHYGTVILPTRVRKPRDKAVVENAVQQVERWVLAPLRHQTFFSLIDANEAIHERLDALNDRPFEARDGSRRSQFLQWDKPALKPLPRQRYEMATWKSHVGVNIDYHIEYKKHYYSVPHRIVGKRVDVRVTHTTLECFYRGERVAFHRRSDVRGGFSTEEAHRPKAHQKSQWSPSRLVAWAADVGPHTQAYVEHVLKHRPHPEQGYRSALGIMRLTKHYQTSRVENACERALSVGATTYRTVATMLKNGLDKNEQTHTASLELSFSHDNLRGATYYTQGDKDDADRTNV